MKRATFAITGCRLDSDHRSLMELGEIPCSSVGTGRAKSCDDFIDQVLDSGTLWIEIHL
jgi:hypothetical protein